ncbi:MAG: hypothetical protein US58_C0029G0007 [Candidatus Magasanikbacteria bacterium GW2011_GWA2_37_8]|uniref:Uncharacterized protein n=1 Tax=Candidatus Magasanikbacteria bacterium GW2011_GWA2_37_8 TaxID=1619036 RepID=A0A0G0JS53_9BACT|nr:MAG: hypothetical protein US58_C0029G0007 [Candidatus Magasanikbacteria bacterium GW2011_GWA2_37_8]
MVKQIFVCNGPTCNTKNAKTIISKLDELTSKKAEEYTIKTCGCMGHCHSAPNVMVDEIIIESVRLDDIENEVLLGNGKKAKTLNEYNADELIKDNFLNDI